MERLFKSGYYHIETTNHIEGDHIIIRKFTPRTSVEPYNTCYVNRNPSLIYHYSPTNEAESVIDLTVDEKEMTYKMEVTTVQFNYVYEHKHKKKTYKNWLGLKREYTETMVNTVFKGTKVKEVTERVGKLKTLEIIIPKKDNHQPGPLEEGKE